MAFINWTDSLSVGVKEFDEQHKILIGLINKLHDAMSQGKAREVMNAVFAELLDYTKVHFSNEQKLFEEYHYPDQIKHVDEHNSLVNQVMELKSKAEKGSFLISIEVLNFLRKWLEHHILEIDKKYGPYFNSKGIK